MQISTRSRVTTISLQLLVVALLAALFALASPQPAAAQPSAASPAQAPAAQIAQVAPVLTETDRDEQPRNVTALAPARLLDTRSDGDGTVDGRFEAAGVLKKKGTLKLEVVGRGGVADDAAAVVLTVTALKPVARGAITVFPCGERRPRAFNVNYRRNDITSVTVLAKVGSGGEVCIFSTKKTDVAVDVNGYVSDEADTVAVTPARLADTRTGRSRNTIDGQHQRTGQVQKKGVLEIQVAGRGGVPSDAVAAILNVTAIKPAGNGSFTVYACEDGRPGSANVNYQKKNIVSNAVLSNLGGDGQVCIFTSKAANVVVDVNGYVLAGPSSNPLAPARLVDTRSGRNRKTVDGQYKSIGKLSAGSTLEVLVAGRGGVPETGVGAVMLNVAAAKASARGAVTVFPCGVDRPTGANVNHRRNKSISQGVLARIGDGGSVCFHASVDTELIIDVNAWFDLPPNQPESDVVVLDEEPFEIETISGGDGPGGDGAVGGVFSEDVVDPEIVRVTTAEPTLVEGDTVVLEKPSGEPYYGEVISAEGSSVVAEEVSLAEVLPTLDLSLESDMDGNLVEIIGAGAVSSFSVEDRVQAENDGKETAFECTTTADVDFTAAATVDVSRFVFDVSFNIFDGLTDARIGFNPTLAAQVTASASAKASCSVYRPLFTKKLPTIKFLVGPIPIWITHEVEVGIGAEVAAEASGSITLLGEASAFAGIVFEDGQWDRRTELTTNFSQEVTDDVVISATISAPVITYKARAYGIAGFDAALAANLRLTYRPFAKKVLSLTTFVDLQVSLVVELDLVVAELHWEHNFPQIMVWGPLELWSYAQSATNCAVSTVPEAQCEALEQLWDEAGGREWTDADTWVSDNDPCGWEGVTCAGSDVVELDLHNKGVNGPIPTAIGGLTRLERLDLGKYPGPEAGVESVPLTIGQLTNLTELRMENADLQALPPEIGELSNLTYLDVSGNGLTSLPETIGGMAQLNRLILDRNPLVSLPREIGELSNLSWLKVNDARLRNLPAEVSELTELTSLDVGKNAISELPYLGNATNMFDLVVSDTEITELPGGFENHRSFFALEANNTPLRSLPVGLGASTDLFQLMLLSTAIDTDITETLRRMQQSAEPGLQIFFTSSGCPVVTDPAVRSWLDGQIFPNFEGPGQTHVHWDANC